MPLLVLSPQRVIKMTKLAGIFCTFLAIVVMAGCAVTSEAKRDAAPAAISILPSSATAGTASQVVLVTGTDFATNTVVLVNGSPRATDYLSVNKLTTMLSTADLAHPSVIEISVAAGTTTQALRPRAETNGAQGLAFTVEASASALQILTSSLPAATIQASYSDSMAAQGGVAPLSWKVTAGELPPGISLSASAGTLSGTPAQIGDFSFSVGVSDSSSTPQTAAELLTLNVGASVAPLTVNFSALPGGIALTSYASTASATGGITPYAWSVASGSLPTGLSLNSSTGAVTGSPTAAGTFSFTLQVKDSSPTPQTASATTSILVVAPLKIATTSLAVPQIQKAYSVTLTTSGGMAPYIWSVAAGALPTGLALNSSTGIISGTPTTAGNYAFTLRVDDPPSLPQTASQSFSTSILAAAVPLQITSPVTMASGTLGTPYTSAFTATGGTPPYTWAGGPRFGLSMSSNGVYSGTPNAAGSSTFVLCVNDSQGAQFCNGTPESITVLPSTSTTSLAITTTNLPSGLVQAPYQGTLIASGGTVPYTWSVTSGTLPTLLALLASTGQISGTPSTAGTSNLTFQVRDSAGASASASLPITIASKPSLTMVTTSLPGGTVGAGYSATLQATGGTQPYVWSVTSGQLPAGLSLGASSGSVSGVPTASGTASFTVEVTDANSLVASLGLTVNIAAAVTSGQAPPSTYASRTDTNAAPETVPALCSPAPCTLTSSDLNPNVKYTRVTDGTTDTYHSPGTTWGTPDSIDNIWAIDNSTFYLQGFPMGDTVFIFNQSTQLAKVMPCSYSGLGCVTGSTSMFVPGQFFNTQDDSYSWTTPSVMYGFVGNLLKKLDFSATVANPATAPTLTTLADMGACSGIPGPNGYSSIVSVSSDDSRIASMTGGSQDGTAHIVYVYDKSQGCRYIASETMTIGGQWGTTGPVVWHDANGSVVATPTFSNLHGAQMSYDGRWIIFSTNANSLYASDNFYWDISTNNVYDQQINSCWLGDHVGYGFDNKAVMTGGGGSLLIATTMPNFGASQCSLIAAPQPAGYAYSVGEHMSWRNARAGQALPISLSPFIPGGAAPTLAWQDELISSATDGSNTVWRFAHMYTRASSYNAQGLQQVSHDGKWVVWCSDWNNSGRTDVFMIPLR